MGSTPTDTIDVLGYKRIPDSKAQSNHFRKKIPAKWSTSDKKIVSVSAKGKIRAKKAGIAYIKVKAGGQTGKIKVVVKKKKAVVKEQI